MWRLVLIVTYCAGKLHRPRVYLGTEDTLNEFPFVVSLEYKGGFRVCTCSLIADGWVITAAHCTRGMHRKVIRYTNFTHNEGIMKYSKILKTFIHPTNFEHLGGSDVIKNDLALLKIEKVPKIPFASLSAVDYKAVVGLPVKYAGFGRTKKEEFNFETSDEDNLRPLQVGEAVVSPCDHRGGYEPAICIAPKCSNKFQDSRSGDSGGPLVFDGKILGVLIGASDPNVPIASYAPVSPNLNWIFEVIRANS